jgi:hypothetical protein
VHCANSWLPEVDVDEIILDDYSEPISQVLDRRVAQGSRFTFIELLVSWRNIWLPARGLDLTCSILREQVEQLFWPSKPGPTVQEEAAGSRKSIKLLPNHANVRV